MISHRGHVLGTGPALTARLRAGLDESQPFPLGRDHRLPSDWLAEAWAAQPQNGAGELAAAVGELLRDPAIKVRSGAIRFFQTAAGADDGGAILAAMQRDKGLFLGVQDVWPGATGDLRAELSRAAAQRIGPDDSPLKAAVRKEALTALRARTVVAALIRKDFDWFVRNAFDIGSTSPDALDPMLFGLRARGVDVRPLVRQLRGALPAAPLRRAIEGVYPSGSDRDQLLALL
jgi:hypothetical protein